MENTGGWNATDIIGVSLYGGVFIVALCSSLWYLKSNEWAITMSVEILFYIFIFLFLIVRVVWLIEIQITFTKDILMSYVFNHTALCLFFSAFSLVIFWWAEEVHSNVIKSTKFLPRLKIAFIVVNVIVYAFEIVAMVTQYLTYSDIAYLVEMMLLAGIYLILSFSFLFYGFCLFVRIHQQDTGSSHKAELAAVTFYSLTFAGCMIIRVSLWIYNPITGKYLNEDLFMVLSIYVPEIIPSLLELYIINSKASQKKVDDNIIQSLYEVEDQLQKEEGSHLLSGADEKRRKSFRNNTARAPVASAQEGITLTGSASATDDGYQTVNTDVDNTDVSYYYTTDEEAFDSFSTMTLPPEKIPLK